MIVLSTDTIKGVLIALMKSATTITNKLTTYGTGASEIREYQWKSRDFLYPAIRVRVIRNLPEDGNCKKANISVSLLVFTEDQSSATCDEISGIIATYFKGRQYVSTFSGNDYSVSLTRVTMIPAMSLGETTWRSEVILEGYLSQL